MYLSDPPVNYCFVLEVDGNVAGYCRLDQDQNPSAFLVSIALAQDFHNRGLGHILLSGAIESFSVKQSKAGELIARIMNGNHASISLFEKNGFVLCGESLYRLSLPHGAGENGRTEK